jgi:hypothetical protein
MSKAHFGVVAAAIATLVSCGCNAEEMCGRTFSSFENLYASFTQERTLSARMDGPRDVMFIDGQGAIWLFAKDSHPAFPAVACVRMVRNGQRAAFERLLWCRASDAGACDVFVADFAGPFEKR